VTAADLVALAPLAALAAGILVLLLAIAARRNARLAWAVTGATVVAALAMVVPAVEVAPRAVTPLLRVDGLGLLGVVLFLLGSLATVPLAARHLAARPGPVEEFPLLLLLATLGAATLALATHVASLLLGLELLSIALYALIAYPDRGRRPLEAALKYLVLSGVSSATLLFGAALLYAESGTLAFAGLVPAAGTGSVLTTAGLALVLAGLAFKLSLVPFHQWTPEVYEGAPVPVTAWLATVGKGAVVLVLLRLLAESGALARPDAVLLLSVLAGASMLAGNLLALLEDDVRRLLAYSSVAHLGYLLVDAAGGPQLGTEAALVYLLAYGVTTFGAFTVLEERSAPGARRQHGAALASEEDFDDGARERFRGLFRRRPAVALAFTVMLLSLAGIPLTAGFVGKFYVVAAGVEGGLWALLALLVVGSGVGLFYSLRLVHLMTLPVDAPSGADVPGRGGWLLGGLTVLVLVLGILPEPVLALVRAALAY
jgi:NADH-quinone oxidoreductase subunit N